MKAKAAQIERISTLEAVDMIDSPNTQVERASDDELRCVQTESIGPVCPIRTRIRDGSASRFIKSE
jgi:hypothetical protein